LNAFQLWVFVIRRRQQPNATQRRPRNQGPMGQAMSKPTGLCFSATPAGGVATG